MTGAFQNAPTQTVIDRNKAFIIKTLIYDFNSHFPPEIPLKALKQKAKKVR